MNDFSIVQGILHAGILVKIILLLMILMSFGTLAVYFQKMAAFKIMEVKNKKFEKKFWSGVMLEDFYQDVKSGSFKSIYGDLFINAMEEWILSDVTQAVMAVEFVKSGTKERVMTAIQNATMVSQSRLQEGLSKLSVIATTAPFIGLLGTVWGIMNSFSSIAGQSSVTLTVIAPGIAEALFSTAIGLFVALPAVALYSNLSKKIGQMSTDIESFGMNVENVLSRELDNFSIKNYLESNK